MIPATFVALIANGWPNAVAVIVAFVIINQIEAHILGPRIVSSMVKVTVLICMDTYSRHFFLLLRRRFHREVILAVSAFGSTG